MTTLQPPKYKVNQQVLSDFSATITEKPNLTKEEIFQKFPEFSNDETFLQSAMDYHETAKSGKYKDVAELNSKFTEFDFEDVKKKDNGTDTPSPLLQEPGSKDYLTSLQYQPSTLEPVTESQPLPEPVAVGPVSTDKSEDRANQFLQEEDAKEGGAQTTWTKDKGIASSVFDGLFSLGRKAISVIGDDIPAMWSTNKAITKKTDFIDELIRTQPEKYAVVNEYASDETRRKYAEEQAQLEFGDQLQAKKDEYAKSAMAEKQQFQKEAADQHKEAEEFLGDTKYFEAIPRTWEEATEKGDAGIASYIGGAIGQGLAQIPLSVVTLGGSGYLMEKAGAYDEAVKAIAESNGISEEDVIKNNLDQPAKDVSHVVGMVNGAIDLGSSVFTAGKAITTGIKNIIKKKATEELLKQAPKNLWKEGAKTMSSPLVEYGTEFLQGTNSQIGALVASGKTLEEVYDNITNDGDWIDWNQSREEGLQGLFGASGVIVASKALGKSPEKTINAPKEDLGKQPTTKVTPSEKPKEPKPAGGGTVEVPKVETQESVPVQGVEEVKGEEVKPVVEEVKQEIKEEPKGQEKISKGLESIAAKIKPEEKEGVKTIKQLETENKKTFPKVPVKNVFSNDTEQPPREQRLKADKHIDDGTIATLPKQEIDVKDIVPTQKNLTIGNLEKTKDVKDSKEEIILLKHEGKFYILDGHHRIANDILQGKKTIEANVYEDTKKADKGSEVPDNKSEKTAVKKVTDITDSELQSELDSFDQTIKEREQKVRESNTQILGNNMGIGTLTEQEFNRYDELKNEYGRRNPRKSQEEAKQAVAKKRADSIAKEKGFDNASHALNSVKKRTGKEYKTVQEVPDKVIEDVKKEREQESFDSEKEKIDKSKKFTDTKDLAVGDYVAVKNDSGNVYEGLVTKSGPKNITVKSSSMYGVGEVQFKRENVQAFYKPKGDEANNQAIESPKSADKFRTHKGEEISGERLTDALNKVADDWADNARKIRQEDEYASHVSEKEKDDTLLKDLEYAEEIRRGEKTNNFTIWQRVNQELTGESVPFLPAKKGEDNNVEKFQEATIEPHKEVKASKTVSIKEIAPRFKLKEMEAGMLYNLKDKSINRLDYFNRKGYSNDFTEPDGLKGQILKKLIDAGYVEELITSEEKSQNPDTDFILTDKGRKFTEAVDARYQTRKQVKAGVDMFPEQSGIPELVIEKAKAKIAKGIEGIVNKIGGIAMVNPLDDTSIWEDVKNIIDGLADIGIAKSEEVIEYLKKEFAKLGIKESDVEEKRGEIVEYVEGEKPKEPEPPKDQPETKKESGRKKALLNRAFEGTDDADLAKSIEKYGLTYEPETWIHAKERAKAFVEEVGFDNALDAVRRNKIEGGSAAFVWSELIDSVGSELAEVTDEEQKQRLMKLESDLIDEFDRKAREGGRFISALQEVYASSDFGYKLDFQVEEYKKRNNGVIEPEVEERFKELDKQLTEAKAKRLEAEERAKKAEDELALQNIKESIAREKKQNTRSSQKIREAKNERAKLKSEFLSLFNPSKSGGKVTASIIPGATLAVYGVKIANTYIKEGVARIEEIVAKTKEFFDKELGYKLSPDELELIQKKIEESVAETEEKEGIVRIPHKMIRAYVESGIDTIEGLVSAIKESIKDRHPNVTDREIRDVITGYGKTINPSKDEVEVKIRKMLRVGKIISALEDVANKKRPLRSGKQRDKLDAQERALNKELKSAMRDLPQDAETEAEQLKTSLDAVKTRLKNQIEELNLAIETGKKSAKAKGVEYDAEAKELADQRDQVKEIYDAIFYKREDDATKIENVLKSIEKAIEATIKKIETNDLEAKKQKKIDSPDIRAARERLSRAKDRLLQLQEEAGIPAKRRLEATKQRLKNQIEDLKERLATGNYDRKKRPDPVTRDSELIKIDAEIAGLKEKFAKEQYKVELKNRTRAQKWIDAAIEIWGLTRALRATGEFSFVLIQNWVYTISHPITALRAIKTAFGHFFSEKEHEDFMNHIRAQDYYSRARASKLAISETDVKLTAREEMFIGSWGNKLWDLLGYPLYPWKSAYEGWRSVNPLKAFERAGTGFLNTIRTTRYIEAEEMLRLQGRNFQEHPEDYKNAADVINTFTGRASLGWADRIAKPLAIVFFSPRNWASIIKQATPYAFYHFGKMTQKDGKVSVAQKMAMSDYLVAIGTTTAIVMLIDAMGGDDDEITVEKDPRSSDFMKIKIGNTRIDPWGGRQSMIVLQARLLMNSIKKDSGQIQKLGQAQTSTGVELIGRIAKNKLSPSSSMAFKFFGRKTKMINGVEVWVDDYGNELYPDPESNLYPIYAETIKELYAEQPQMLAHLITFMSFWGLGTQTYDPQELKRKKYEYYQRVYDQAEAEKEGN